MVVIIMSCISIIIIIVVAQRLYLSVSFHVAEVHFAETYSQKKKKSKNIFPNYPQTHGILITTATTIAIKLTILWTEYLNLKVLRLFAFTSTF